MPPKKDNPKTSSSNLSLEEMKEFVLFCKDQKVSNVSIDGISFSFNPLAFIPEKRPNKIVSEQPEIAAKTDIKGISESDEERILFHSV